MWAEEAFSLWATMWLDLYDFGTESFELIERIRDTYFLVAIIDNNFLTKDHDDASLFRAIFNMAGVQTDS